MVYLCRGSFNRHRPIHLDRRKIGNFFWETSWRSTYPKRKICLLFSSSYLDHRQYCIDGDPQFDFLVDEEVILINSSIPIFCNKLATEGNKGLGISF